MARSASLHRGLGRLDISPDVIDNTKTREDLAHQVKKESEKNVESLVETAQSDSNKEHFAHEHKSEFSGESAPPTSMLSGFLTQTLMAK